MSYRVTHRTYGEDRQSVEKTAVDGQSIRYERAASDVYAVFEGADRPHDDVAAFEMRTVARIENTYDHVSGDRPNEFRVVGTLGGTDETVDAETYRFKTVGDRIGVVEFVTTDGSVVDVFTSDTVEYIEKE